MSASPQPAGSPDLAPESSLAEAWRTLRALTSTLRRGSDAGFEEGVRIVAAHSAVEGATLIVEPATAIGLPQRFQHGDAPREVPTGWLFEQTFTDGNSMLGSLEIRLGQTERSVLFDEWSASVADLFAQAIARRREEHAALAVQRVEVSAALAAGIAHDFNNVMTGIIGTTTLLQYQEPPNEETVRLAQQIEQSAWSGARVARDLLRFVRGLDEPEPAIEVGDIVHSAVQLASPALKGVAIKVDDFEGEPAVAGVRVLLEQAIVNLILQQGRSMPDGGVVVVALASDDGCVTITVEGESSSTVPAAPARAGLDVDAARRIVERHGGRLESHGATEAPSGHTLSLPLEGTGR